MLEFFKQAIAKSPLIYWCLSTSCDGSVWKEAGWEGAFTALCWPFVEIAFKSTPRQLRMKTSSLSRCSARTQVQSFLPMDTTLSSGVYIEGSVSFPARLVMVQLSEFEIIGIFPPPPTFHLLGWVYTAVILCKYVTMWRHKGDWAIRCRKAIFFLFYQTSTAHLRFKHCWHLCKFPNIKHESEICFCNVNIQDMSAHAIKSVISSLINILWHYRTQFHKHATVAVDRRLVKNRRHLFQ